MTLSLANNCTNLTGGISRLWCDQCESETLHRGLVCGCGAIHRAYPVRDISHVLRGTSMENSMRRGGKKAGNMRRKRVA